MTGWPAIGVFVAVFVVTLGLPLALYVALTRRRRAAMREIRLNSDARGWKFQFSHWTGNPTAFRIDGHGRTGLSFVLKSSASSGYEAGWNATLSLRFSELAGEPDVAVLPRNAGGRDFAPRGVPPKLKARVEAYSGLAASAIRLLEEGKETPSGEAKFDAAYRVVRLGVSWQPLVDAKLAERIMAWPSEAYALHALLAWRDPFGFHIHARLPAPPNWATICYVVELADDLCARLPAGKMAGPPKGIVDQFLAGILSRR
jgi:hypothetical protein